MEAEATIEETMQTVEQFASAVQNKDYELITSLLAEDGKFNTQDTELNTIDGSSKVEFLKWLSTALTGIEISKIEYDTCVLCKTGNPVVIFNEGQFPKVKKDLSIKSMNGLMLEIKDGLITGISFCYYFAERENKTQADCLIPKIDKLEAEGLPRILAAKIVFTKEGYLKDEGVSDGPVIYIAPDIV